MNCESLETRQLLSIGQPGFAAGVLANPAISAAMFSVPATVSNFTAPSIININIEFGTFGGLNQIQIVVSESGPIFRHARHVARRRRPVAGIVSTGKTGIGNNVTGSIFPSDPISGSSITPLNPSVTSSTNTPGGPPVALVPPPLAPLAVHLGSSTTPATTQSNSTMISLRR